MTATFVSATTLVHAQLDAVRDPQPAEPLTGSSYPSNDRVVIVLKEGVDLLPEDYSRDGMALRHLPGFESLADRFDVSQLRALFPHKDRGPEWEPLNRTFLVKLRPGTAEQAAALYSVLPAVESAFPDLVGSLAFVPNGAGLDNGRAWVYSGANGSVLLSVVGDPGHENFRSGRPAGDFDADGHVDFIVGADLADSVSQSAGKSYVFSGADGSRIAVFTGSSPGDRFGQGVGVGDVNGDGGQDLAIAALYDDNTGTDAGSVRIVLGAVPPSSSAPGIDVVDLSTQVWIGEPRPNPTTGAVNFQMSLPRTEAVAVVVYDVAGRAVREIIRSSRPAGVLDLSWDGRDEHGRPVASGLYLYSIEVGDERTVRRGVHLR